MSDVIQRGMGLVLVVAATSGCGWQASGAGNSVAKPLVPGAMLNLHIVVPDGTPNALVMTVKRTNERLHLDPQPVYTASDVNDVRASMSPLDGEPTICVTSTSVGKIKLQTATKSNVGERLAIVVNGELMDAPTIHETVMSMFYISANLTTEQRDHLLAVLTAQ